MNMNTTACIALGRMSDETSYARSKCTKSPDRFSIKMWILQFVKGVNTLLVSDAEKKIKILEYIFLL